MGYEHLLEYMVLGAMGAAALEVIKAYEQYNRFKPEEDKFQEQIKSPYFWCILTLFLLASGFVSWAVNANAVKPNPIQIVSVGAAARTLFREIISAQVAKAGPSLGFNWRSMFR